MNVTLLYNTPLWVCAKAIRKCWASEGKSDSIARHPYDGIICGPNDKALIDRVGNQNKHSSTLEHLVYSFDIEGISRACLQEIVRHRIASYSVKSTRYTLKELKEEQPFMDVLHDEPKLGFMSIGSNIATERASKYLVFTGTPFVDNSSILALEGLRGCLTEGVSNDKAKYCLPDAYKTSLVMTINARSLQNFLYLRTSKAALWEIRDLAMAMYNCLPEDHKYLFEGHIYKESDK